MAFDHSPEGIEPKYYGIKAEDQGITRTLHLTNAHYVNDAAKNGSDEIEASRTFDFMLYYNPDKDSDKGKEIFHIDGLKIDSAVQYDPESRTFTATVDQDQSFDIEFSNPEYYTNSLNSLMNDHLDPFI